ncbi:MAG: type II-A CRISPR-associated protein Csn2 [Firmicutes bacterium]|nr:type II-A CRISPR-associated protein Csn2 [Bacillota bacterium]
MLLFKHASWEKHFQLDGQKISVLAVENPSTLWKYCTELIGQSNGEAGDFSILKNYSEQVFDKLCSVETNIPGLTLNSKKLQTALIKKCSELSVTPEFEEQLRKVSLSLYEFCKTVCQDVGYSIELHESIDTAGLFKLFSLSLKETFGSLLEKLIEYVQVNAEFLKTKIFIFLFLSKFLSREEIKKFFEHCRFQGISLILIEESFPQLFNTQEIPNQGLIIDYDGFEITKNLKDTE